MSFYARYVPSSSSPASTSLKRPASGTPQRAGKKQRTETPAQDEARVETGTTEQRKRAQPHTQYDSSRNGIPSRTFPSLLKDEVADGTKPASKPKREKKQKPQSAEEEPPEQPQVHRKVLSKYSKHRLKQLDTPVRDVDNTPEQQSERAEIHDLEPIPQPEVISAPATIPRYSTLPSWLEQPVTVSTSETQPFSELSLHETLQHNLKSQSLVNALPIQCAVLPLVLGKSLYYRTDLCVAAATGSGKTLAYILPILQSLLHHESTKLRALVIVPTRALVKQVVQTFESVSAKCHVKVVGAEGSRTLAEEQAQLVGEYSVYNSKEYERKRNETIDWSHWSLEKALKSSIEERTQKYGYISSYASKCDVLVTTPGRLVEHLNSTQGFSLVDVEWFVADEADRLLNESYQEWLEIVLPALKDQSATARRDRLFEELRLDVPRRKVTKILLSATMTQDISQLLALELESPKLVLVEHENMRASQTETHNKPTAIADFQLPPRLEESAVPVKDSADKPLYLLEILNQHILVSRRASDVAAVESTKHEDTSDADSTSDSDSDVSSTSSASSLTSSASSSSSSSDSNTNASIKPLERPRIPNASTVQPSSTTTPALPRVLIFTSSTQSAHRLSRLISLLQPAISSQIATFTRTSSSITNTSNSNPLHTHPSEKTSTHRTQKKVLHDLATGKTTIVITTDLAARGLDIPHLTHVLNYDIPSSTLTYVHRVGRTARANRPGHAWTLLEHRQAKWFWDEIGGRKHAVASGNPDVTAATVQEQKIVRSGEIKKVNLRIDPDLRDGYEAALAQLGKDVRG